MANPENKQIPYESTQKDIRDAIESVATAIGGIAIPSADHVSYDNSVSGLSATDVQNALDEIVSDIPTVNNGTLTIQQNGTSIGSFSANTASNVTANIKTPTADKKTATTEFNTANGGLLSKCQINLVPVQSGSGDPYPAGGGKNKLNPTGTSQTVSGLVVVKNADGTFNISGGNSSSQVQIALIGEFTITNGESYRLSGCPTGGGLDSYRLDVRTSPSTLYGSNVIDNGNGVNFTASEDATLYVYARFFSNYSISGTLHFEPMIIKGTTPTSYAPYSNVRPISGHTEVDLYNVGKNLFDEIYTDIGEAILYKELIVTNGTYTMSSNCPLNSQNSCNLFFLTTGESPSMNTNGVWNLQSRTINVTDGKIRIAYRNRYSINPEDYNTQIEKGSDATTYESYNPSSHLYQVQIGSTVYGGYVDLVSGVMNVDRAYLKPTAVLNVFQDGGSGLYYWIVATNLGSVNGANAVSSHFKSVASIASGNCYIASAGQQLIAIPTDQTSNTKELASAWCVANEPEFVYLIATPQSIQLTPQQIETLVGQNNLSTPLDGQSIETNGVEYKELFTFADVKSYVDKKIPDAPTTDGTYTLQAVVSGGVPTYSWV